MKSANAYVVRERDKFKHREGFVPVHERYLPKPGDEQQDAGEVWAAWGRALLVQGGMECEVMSRKELDAIRARSASVRAGRRDSPWFTDEEEQQKKTVVRRLMKRLPLSPVEGNRQAAERFAKAMEIDDAEYIEAEAAPEAADAKKGAERAKARLQGPKPMSEADIAAAKAKEQGEPGSDG